VLGEGTDEAQAVERRRPQVVHQAADLGQRRPSLVAEFNHQRLAAGRVHGDQTARGVGVQNDPGEDRSEPVVKVATHSATFLLAGGDHLLTRPPQFLG
jgi:hypothetical protein